MKTEYPNKISEAAEELHKFIMHEQDGSGLEPCFIYDALWRTVTEEGSKTAVIQDKRIFKAAKALRKLFRKTRGHHNNVVGEREIETALMSYLVKNNLF